MTDLAIVLFTLRMAALSTLLILPFALGLAAWSWRAGAKGLVLDAIGALPLVVPPTAIGFVLLELLSRRAPIGRLLDRIGIDVLFTPKAVVIACGVMAFPLMFTAFRVAIETTERRFFDIARTLGATPLRAFARVTLPLAWRGLLSGNIPGRTQTLALAIYDRVQIGREAEAGVLVFYVVGVAWVLVGASGLLIAQQRKRFAA